MIKTEERMEAIRLIDDACANGARLTKACEVLNITPRAIQRWRLSKDKPDGRKIAAIKRKPVNTLSDKEQEQILTISNIGEC